MLFANRNGVLDSKSLPNKAVLQALTNTSKNYHLSEIAVNEKEMVDVSCMSITAVDLKRIDPMLDSSKTNLSPLFLHNLLTFLRTKIAR